MLKLKTEFWLGIATIFGIIIVIGLSFYAQLKTPIVIPTNSALETKQPVFDAHTINLTTLGLHNNSSDCWIAVSGVVYDLTSFANSHSGGSRAIRDNCGTDSTTIFLNQHRVNLLKFIFNLKVANLIK